MSWMPLLAPNPASAGFFIVRDLGIAEALIARASTRNTDAAPAGLSNQIFRENGGRYKVRTCDPYDVNFGAGTLLSYILH